MDLVVGVFAYSHRGHPIYRRLGRHLDNWAAGQSRRLFFGLNLDAGGSLTASVGAMMLKRSRRTQNAASRKWMRAILILSTALKRELYSDIQEVVPSMREEWSRSFERRGVKCFRRTILTSTCSVTEMSSYKNKARTSSGDESVLFSKTKGNAPVLIVGEQVELQ